MKPGERARVVVVGAGPVGLMLAGELRLGGAGVVVLETLTEPSTESRASTLHARTMEIFDSRGLLESLGTPPRDAVGHFGGIKMDLTLPGPFPGQWKVLQARTAAVLEERARALGADIRRGYAVDGLVDTGDEVVVEAHGPRGPLTVVAEYVVGCDGEHSTVRRLSGVPFPGRDAGRELLRGDVAGITVPDRRFERLPRGLAVAARRPDGVTRVMVHESGGAPVPRTGEPAFEELAKAWHRVTGEDISGGEPLWMNAFDDTTRQVARYRDGRVLFAGDAAHRQMPIGGQALNLGIQDAVNLGWKLAAVVGGRHSAALLDSYHDERHAVGAQTLSGISAQAELLFGGPEIEPLRAVFGRLIGQPDVRAELAGTISGTGLRYEFGDGLSPLVGRRLPPELLGSGSAVPALLRGGKGLLLLAGDGESLAAAASNWADRVEVAVSPGTATIPHALLVRPDGYVAWVPDSPTTLESALGRWFGPPADLRTAKEGDPWRITSMSE